MKKLAVLQVADTSPLESLVMMLREADCQCALPSESLQDTLRSIGCDTVLSHKALQEGLGYEQERFGLPIVDEAGMNNADLYVDVKAHRNGPHVTKVWPNLRDRVLWYRINGGEPCITPHGGDEINPGCPILTPNRWYGERLDAYWCWPPFARLDQHSIKRGVDKESGAICLIHNLKGWGHADIADELESMRAPIFYFGGCKDPDGLLPHHRVPHALSEALAMVHLKSNDCPGYALYEAIASRCPVILSRKLIWRMRQEDLWVEGETCLCFDEPGHQNRTPAESRKCAEEINGHLEALRANPALGVTIAMRAIHRWADLQWKADRDGGSLRLWLRRMFP